VPAQFRPETLVFDRSALAVRRPCIDAAQLKFGPRIAEHALDLGIGAQDSAIGGGQGGAASKAWASSCSSMLRVCRGRARQRRADRLLTDLMCGRLPHFTGGVESKPPILDRLEPGPRSRERYATDAAGRNTGNR
jgi:hypothetical protein